MALRNNAETLIPFEFFIEKNWDLSGRGVRWGYAPQTRTRAVSIRKLNRRNSQYASRFRKTKARVSDGNASIARP